MNKIQYKVVGFRPATFTENDLQKYMTCDIK